MLSKPPDRSESPKHQTYRIESNRIESVRLGEWCQQTLRQACSQAFPGSARCVQSFNDSLDSASRKTYRISLRSSSLWEPRHPSLKVLHHSWMEGRTLLRRGGSLDRSPPFLLPFALQIHNLLWFWDWVALCLGTGRGDQIRSRCKAWHAPRPFTVFFSTSPSPARRLSPGFM